MKKILIISLLFTSFLVTSCGKKVDNTETPNNSENIISQNTNPNVVKKQEIEGLLFDNIILKTNNNMSYFTANVTNTNSATLSYQWYSTTSTTATGGTAISGATKNTYEIDKSFKSYYEEYFNYKLTDKDLNSVLKDEQNSKSMKYDR